MDIVVYEVQPVVFCISTCVLIPNTKYFYILARLYQEIYLRCMCTLYVIRCFSQNFTYMCVFVYVHVVHNSHVKVYTYEHNNYLNKPLASWLMLSILYAGWMGVVIGHLAVSIISLCSVCVCTHAALQ